MMGATATTGGGGTPSAAHIAARAGPACSRLSAARGGGETIECQRTINDSSSPTPMQMPNPMARCFQDSDGVPSSIVCSALCTSCVGSSDDLGAAPLGDAPPPPPSLLLSDSSIVIRIRRSSASYLTRTGDQPVVKIRASIGPCKRVIVLVMVSRHKSRSWKSRGERARVGDQLSELELPTCARAHAALRSSRHDARACPPDARCAPWEGQARGLRLSP